MLKRSFRSTWLVAMLAIGLAVFGIGCSDDDDDDGPTGPTAPEAPVLTSRPTGSVNLAQTEPELAWTEVTDAVNYQVQVAANSSFSGTGLIIDETLPAEDDGTPVLSYKVQVNLLVYGTQYYYRMRAILDATPEDDTDDVTEASQWTSAGTFTPQIADPTGYDEILQGEILTDKTLETGKTYLLRGGVFVGRDDASVSPTLTIQPGVTIHGENATDGMLVIRRGAQIDAQGTAQAPIVFTSDQPAGSRARGMWGGVIVNGRATLNTGAEAEGEGGTGKYGGTSDADNSGTIRYVRIEFAGREISPDNELNGLALQGVGSGTTIEYVQIHMNKDDGIEFFGGTVNARYIYVTGAADDQFDWTDGWRGKGQFWICQQYEDDADQGFENDSNGDNNGATPFSDATVYNFTLIGAKNTANGESDIGMLLREGLKGTYRNGIVTNFGESGVDVDGSLTHTHATSGDLSVTHTIFFGNEMLGSNDDDGFDDAAFITSEASNLTSDPLLAAPTNTAAPDFTPGSGSPALDANNVATPPSDGFFESVSFIGGMDPANNWLSGWITTAQN